MTYTFDENIVSDLHKEAYGFRPTQNWWAMWAAFNPDQMQSEWDRLIQDMDEATYQQEQLEAEAIIDFRKLLKATMSTCNVDWKNALRILMDASEIDPSEGDNFDYFLWQHDIGYTKRQEIHAKFVG